MIAFDELLEILDPSVTWILRDADDGDIICESTDDNKIINIYIDLWIGNIFVDEHGTLILTTANFTD